MGAQAYDSDEVEGGGDAIVVRGREGVISHPNGDAGATTLVADLGDGSAIEVSAGQAHDSTLAESVIGLFKAEVIRRKGPWRTLEAVEFATLEWVDWFNHRRLLAPIGYIPPAEYEARYYGQAAVA